ncbi:type 4a pilus biogenesis protein PilO [Desulforhopalus vacuolatus]|nr:type 4a pilus biogenesis protein PilO [Desulforhopalus vacuolatus]
MNTGNSAFTTFLDEKFIPLSNRAKAGLCLVIVILPVLVFYFTFYGSRREMIHKLKEGNSKIQTEINDYRKQVAMLPDRKKKVAEIRQAFEKISALLPREKEIPQLLKDISSLGRNAGLDFNTFKPEKESPKDFYQEIPITINVRGPYHNMGYFFDQVSKLERIVSVNNIKMVSPQKEDGEMLLKSNCQLVTYQFTNKALEDDKKKKKK